MIKRQGTCGPAHSVAPGLLRRLAAMLYDWLLLIALMLVATSLITLPFGMPSGFSRILFQLLLFGLMPLLFFSGFWVMGGQTLGMRAWRIKVVAEDGNPLSWGSALLRFLAALLSLLAGGLGYIWILMNPEKLAWHDRLSRTMLVMLEPRNRS